MTTSSQNIPYPFILKKLHSLTGFWLALFLLEHLFINSQAALFIGDNGKGFIKAANALHELPYLSLIETIFLGLPFAIHGLWGIKYALTAKLNSFPSNGSKPSLGQYPRNQAFTWQRMTSWVLLVGVIAHVLHMRVIERPIEVNEGLNSSYLVRLSKDNGLVALSKKLDFEVYDEISMTVAKEFALKNPLSKNQVIIIAKNFGTAELLLVRETFKMPIMMALYTIFVLAAAYHGFNGLWTFMIAWGVTLTATSQRYMRFVANGIMVVVAFLGLATIWMTYWINLK